MAFPGMRNRSIARSDAKATLRVPPILCVWLLRKNFLVEAWKDEKHGVFLGRGEKQIETRQLLGRIMVVKSTFVMMSGEVFTKGQSVITGLYSDLNVID